jgi:hypothetical protein
VLTMSGLRDIFDAHGFDVTDSWGTGYYPVPKVLESPLASIDPNHAHFIGVVARVHAAQEGLRST